MRKRIRRIVMFFLVVLLSLGLMGRDIRLTPAAKAAPDYSAIWWKQKDEMKEIWRVNPPQKGETDEIEGALPALKMEDWRDDSNSTKASGSNVWKVKTANQLRYAFEHSITGDIIDILANLNMGGMDIYGKLTDVYWIPVDKEGASLTVRGNHKTIYNLQIDTNSQRNSSFLLNLGSNSKVSDLTFKNVSIYSTQKEAYPYLYPDRPLNQKGEPPNFPTGASLFAEMFRENIVFENVGMENALVSSDGYWAFAFLMTMKDEALTGDNFSDVRINNCYTKNVVCYAPGSTGISCSSAFVGGGLGTTRTDGTGGLQVTNCYSVDSMVIASSGHSGGFSSCNWGKLVIKNSFSDVVVYGDKATGAFQGVIHQGDALFENCFALGSIEGKEYIGGFAAAHSREVPRNGYYVDGIYHEGYDRDSTIEFKNCYTGAIVGMVNGGKTMGSFLGAATYPDDRIKNVPPEERAPQKIYFTNCYAMGETGNIDTYVAISGGSPESVGGFMGNHLPFKGENRTDFIFKKCYYDKQTTAMREWVTGISQELQSSVSGGDKVIGVLTTNTKKGGRGLTGLSEPGISDGFQEFTNEGEWDYVDGKYPELMVFKNAQEWNETEKTGFSNTNLVKAYSAASVAAVRLEPWAELKENYVYDTVRDLTVGFELTSGVDWRKIRNPHRNEDASNPVSSEVKLYNEGTAEAPSYMTLPVLTLETEDGVTYARNPAPGIQWLSANVTMNVGPGAAETGQRRLRVIPTANLYTGKSTIVKTGNTVDPYKEIYDHADDVYMAYSTGQRMSRDMEDITQGVYPDDNLTQKQSNVNVRAGSWKKDKGIEENKDEEYKFLEAATDHLQEGSRITVDGMRLAYSQKVGDVWQEIDHVENGDLERNGFGADDNLGLDNDRSKRFNMLFNGDVAFTKDAKGEYTLLHELGVYALRYKWKLADGRYLEGGKIISVIKGLNDAVIEVQDGEEHPVADAVTPGISFNQTDPDLTGPTLARTEEPNIPYGTNTRLGWRHKFRFEDIKQVDVQIGRDSFTNVLIDQPMEVKRTYYKDFFMERDRMNITAVKITKTYKLKKEGTATYLRFTEKPDESIVPEFQFEDLEEDVRVLVVVPPAEIWINFRQLVLNSVPKVPVPDFGYGKINEVPNKAEAADFTQSRNVVCPSYGITDPRLKTENPQTNFIRYRLPANEFYRVTPIIPQYHKLVLISYSPSGAIGSEFNTKDSSVVLEYKGTKEYWVTFQLRSEESPNPNYTTEATPNAFPAFTPAPTAVPTPTPNP